MNMLAYFGHPCVQSREPGIGTARSDADYTNLDHLLGNSFQSSPTWVWRPPEDTMDTGPPESPWHASTPRNMHISSFAIAFFGPKRAICQDAIFASVHCCQHKIGVFWVSSGHCPHMTMPKNWEVVFLAILVHFGLDGSISEHYDT